MNVMTFKKALDVKAIDIVDAWIATNTDTEVAIILNNRGKYELWMAETLITKTLHGIFETFDAAVRKAECIFDVTVPASGN